MLVLGNRYKGVQKALGAEHRGSGTDYDNIVRNVEQLIRDDEAYLRMSQTNNPYGDGQASRRI